MTVGKDETILQCDLVIDDKTVSINVHSSSAIQEDFYDGRLYGIGRGICGFKVVRASLNDPKELAFNVTTKIASKPPVTFTHDFQVTVKKTKNNPIDNYEIDLTKRFDYHYSIYPLSERATSCKIYRPSGKLLIEDERCMFKIERLTMEDVGQWTVEFALKNSMKPMRVHFNTILKEANVQGMWYKEMDGYGLIGCSTPVFNEFYDKCIFTKPDKSIFVLTDTFASERYVAIGSNLAGGIAQIQLKLPLMKSEIGRWSCQFNDKIGEFIDVGSPSRARRGASQSYGKRIKKMIDLGKPFEILCSVPHPIDNCFIKEPNGTIHNMDPTSTNALGECLHKVQSGKEEDKGVWTCFLSNPDNIEDDMIITEVEISNELETSNKQLDVLVGDSVTFLFKRHNPIDTCYCKGPAGATYFLSETKTEGNIVYRGKGLHVGECGMRIEKTEAEHDGVWECFSKIHDENIYSSQIRLTIIHQILRGISIGVPVGISIAALVIIILIVYYWYTQRRERRNVEQENRSSLSSENSDTLFIINSPFQRN